MGFNSNIPPQLADARNPSQTVTVVDSQTATAVNQVNSSVQDSNVNLSAILAQDQIIAGDIGSKTDAPDTNTEDTTAKSGISLWKSIKNYLKLIDANAGVKTGAAVITDADGTMQQYLRGLVKLLVAKITVQLDSGTNVIGKVGIDQTTPGTTNKVDIGTPTVVSQKSYLRETPVASAGRTTSGDSGTLSTDYGPYAEIVAQLNVTAHVGATGTLDVKIQHSIDNAATWDDLGSFSQVTTTDGAIYLTLSRWDFTGPIFFGNKLKVVWTLAGVSPNFTFNVDWVMKS